MVTVAYDLRDATHGLPGAGASRPAARNSRSLSYRVFAPEEVSAVELGLKSQFWNDRARLNVARCSTRGSTTSRWTSSSRCRPTARTVSDTTNATTSGDSRGAEAGTRARADRRPDAEPQLHADRRRRVEAPNPYVAGNPLARVLPLNAPKNAGSLAVDYRIPLGGRDLKFHPDGNWSDGFYTSERLEQTLTDSSVHRELAACFARGRCRWRASARSRSSRCGRATCSTRGQYLQEHQLDPRNLWHLQRAADLWRRSAPAVLRVSR